LIISDATKIKSGEWPPAMAKSWKSGIGRRRIQKLRPPVEPEAEGLKI